MSRSTPALSCSAPGTCHRHRQLDGQPLVAAGDHLGGVAARDAQQVVARLRLGRQELDPDAGLGLRAVLAGAAPRHLTAHQRRAATAAEADRDDDDLADRQRPARRIRRVPLAPGRTGSAPGTRSPFAKCALRIVMWGSEGDCIIEKRSFVKWIAESSWLADRRLRLLLPPDRDRRRPRGRPRRRPPARHGSARRSRASTCDSGILCAELPPRLAAGPERRPGPRRRGCTARKPTGGAVEFLLTQRVSVDAGERETERRIP